MAGMIPDEPQFRASIGPDTWLDHPANRYTLMRAAEFVRSAVWSPAAAPARTRQPAAPLLARLQVPALAGGTISALDHLLQGHADSLLLFEGDDLVTEWHAPGVDPARPHLLFSIGKSITGILAGQLTAEGRLDPEAQAQSLVPRLRGTPAGTATVRQMLDMTVSLAYSETFDGSPSVFTRYRQAVWGNGPETLLDVVADMEATPEGHGTAFRYISPMTDVLGLAIEAASGRRFVDLLAERLLVPLGMTRAWRQSGCGHSRWPGHRTRPASRPVRRCGRARSAPHGHRHSG
jgi:CubicO group peptidase (beta-lactamase class C family)